jgi:serine protease Do
MIGRQRRRIVLVVLLALMVTTAMLVVLFLNAPAHRRIGGGGGGFGPELSGVVLAPAAPLSGGGPLDAAQIFEMQAPAVVLLAAVGDGTAIGSGFIVSPSGLVVTNYHVVAPATRGGGVAARLKDGRVVRVQRVVAVDARRDLAVLALAADGLPSVRLGDSDAVRPGEKVVVIGHPQFLDYTVSEGIVSGLRSDNTGYRYIQITAAISSGSSGGPVFDATGRVIAVTVMTLRTGQNLNFAIPVNDVRAILGRLGLR